MNTDNKKNRTVLITGATSGIGYELSTIFAQNGYELVLVARNNDRLEKMAYEISQKYQVKAEFISKDLSIPTSPVEIFNEINKKSINVDILINNAGFNVYGLFSETDLQKELEMLQVHIVTLTHLTKLFLPGMLKRNYGKIMNLGSTGSFAPGPYNSIYCATKAYVLSFSEAIAEELKGTGVTVTTLCPGPVKTEFAQRAKMENLSLFQGKILDAKKVAEVGYKALVSGKMTVVVGFLNKVQMFFIRLTPRKTLVKIAKIVMTKK